MSFALRTRKRSRMLVIPAVVGVVAGYLVVAGAASEAGAAPPSKEPVANVEHVTVVEGDAGVTVATFEVSLSTPPKREVTIDHATADGTATAGVDYVPVSGTLVFPRRVSRQTISVDIKGDTDFEADEVFFLELSNAVNATIGMGTAEGRIANDDVQPRTLTVAVDGSGTGAVTSDPAGIDCPGDCDETYGDGDTVVLTAAAEAGSLFAGWGGDCAGTDPTCTVVMDADRAVTASFDVEASTHLLTVTVDGEVSGDCSDSCVRAVGKVSSDPPGIDCFTHDASTPEECSEEYDDGSMVTLTAAAGFDELCGGDPLDCSPIVGDDSHFAGWGGACESFGTAETCTVTMDQAHDVTAMFTLEDSSGGSHPLTVGLMSQCTFEFVETCGSGTVTSSPAGIECSNSPDLLGGSLDDCAEDYPDATMVTLTATPELAYQCVALVCGSVLAPSTFEGWGGACASAGLNQTCTVTMDQARHATATFGA